MNKKKLNELLTKAKAVRRDILSMSYRAKSAHSGGAYSCVEILVALYFDVMRVNAAQAQDPKRDRLIFSKAHDAKALYAVLAERGFFDTKILEKYESDDGILPGHSTRHCVPGIEASAGALGHGLSMAVGMAYAQKIRNSKFEIRNLRNPRVFAVLSDGECDEGSTWEAVLFAGHHQLDNLTVVVDYNKLQGYGFTKDILNLEPFADKWNAFGWSPVEVDGHDFKELTRTLSSVPLKKGRPTVVIAHTIKGQGGPKQHVGKVSSQYKPPTDDEYKETMNQLTK
ncbi:hypothetical protein A3A63_02110 [Candidatus Gottesmanbacteria bacterium RIFCSPLOWO2_01_FULL_46_9]|uniref:Transketolase N-terminal domain-containing protein n=1 Tax=Candidatus Gottesmanbacteria bacterium RIFCSPLOWO2_01_FULL_46_9 TaxID=1798394 RepID=A0A1F6AWS6_9BACT|nr:MAG: hypothetical protein A3A63_02110 [Candidatus Gottesmanbacteria bacterium RIFCSPLOWO2_01_FULL_46_9]